MNIAKQTSLEVGIVLATVSGVTTISGIKCKKARVTKNAIVDPIANKPSNCLISPFMTVFHFLYTHPTQTALEGPRNGAAHMAPIITGALLANKPAVARRDDATTRTK
jgi:hypothetical protein